MTSADQATILIMAGGTGGHVFPALALADELRKRQCEVHWLGTATGLESRVVPEAGFELHTLEITGVRGKGWWTLVSAPARIVAAVALVRKLIKRIRPQLVVGFGGYVAGPGGVAARWAGIPLVIHEQNARAGTTNRLLARLANKVLTAFPDVLPKGFCTGNPVRASIVGVEPPDTRYANRSGKLRLLVLGGSLGATAINEIVPQALSQLPQDSQPDVWHQTGERHLPTTQGLYGANSLEARIDAFIDDMKTALEWADLVICRAGALTVSELSSVGVAAILIPFPHAIDDHQTANAQWLVNAGGALMYQQRDLSAAVLSQQLLEFSTHRARLEVMAKAARAVAKPHATKQIADICMEVAHA